MFSLLSKTADKVDFLLFTSRKVLDFALEEDYATVFSMPTTEDEYMSIRKCRTKKKCNIRAHMQVSCQWFVNSKEKTDEKVWFPVSTSATKLAQSVFKDAFDLGTTATALTAARTTELKQEFEAAHKDSEV